MTTTRQIERDAAHLWRFCQVNGVPDESRVRQVVDQLAESAHSGGPAVLQQFARLLKLDRDRHTAHVSSAVPLDARARTSVERDLRARFGDTVAIRFTTDASLIAGLRVRVGSEVYDASVRAQLDALEASF